MKETASHLTDETSDPDRPIGKLSRAIENISGELLLFTVFAVINIVFVLRNGLPIAYPDEYGVLSIGNWLFGGESWGYKPSFYYGYAFAPLAGIIIRLFDDINDIYTALLLIKALIVSLVPVFCYKILNELLNVEEKKIKLLISSAVSLYPAFIIFSKQVRNETELFLTLFICFYLIGKCVSAQTENKTRLYSVLLSFFAVLAYAAHGMGLALIVTVFIVIISAHIVTKRKLVSYTFFVVSFLFFFF